MTVTLVLLLIVSLGPGMAAPTAPSLQELTQLVNQLRAQDAALRTQAAIRLGQLRDPRAVSLLAPLCKLPQYSEAACDILVRTGRDGVTALLKLTGSKEHWLRRQVISALGASNDPRAVTAVRAALKDADAGLRTIAVQALAPRADDRAIAEALFARLQDAAPAVRDAALTALQERPDPRLIAPLAGWLQSGNRGRMDTAIDKLQTLVRLGHTRALEPLLALAHDARPGARSSAIRAIATLADPRVSALCLTALRDPEAMVRQAAASAASFLADDPRLVEALLAALGDTDGGVRQAAAESLGLAKSDRALAALLQHLGGADAAARAGAIAGLGRTNHPQAITALLGLLAAGGGEAPRVVRALSLCTDPRIAETFLTLLPQADDNLRADLYGAFARLRDPRALEPLLAAVTGEQNRHLIMGALGALQALGDPRAADGVMTLYRTTQDGNLRGMALATLGALKDPRVFPLLLAALEMAHLRQYAIAGLAAYGGPQAFDTLAPMLNDRDQQVRAQVLEAMTTIDDPRAVPLLIAALGQPNPWVRLAIAQGLKKFGPQAHNAVGPLITVMEADPAVASRQRLAETLFAITGQAFGQDPAAWRAWLQGP